MGNGVPFPAPLGLIGSECNWRGSPRKMLGPHCSVSTGAESWSPPPSPWLAPPEPQLALESSGPRWGTPAAGAESFAWAPSFQPVPLGHGRALFRASLCPVDHRPPPYCSSSDWGGLLLDCLTVARLLLQKRSSSPSARVCFCKTDHQVLTLYRKVRAWGFSLQYF